MTLPAKEQTRSAPLTLDRLPSILWATAVDAFVKTLLVLVLGQVTISVVGGIWHDMTPTMPPGIGFETHGEKGSASVWKPLETSLKHKGPYFLCAVFFVLLGWQRLAGAGEREGEPATRTKKILKRVSEDWFGLIVWNGFGALISAMILVWVPQFSYAQWIWHWVLGAIGPVLQNGQEHLLGVERADAVRAWFGWYGENQFKFNFWLLYVAAICDDLGIPNLKTLARWLWRRVRNRERPEKEQS